MILSCPACTARFVVDPAALGEQGRMVRCARCRETWYARPTDEDMAQIVPMAESFPHFPELLPAQAQDAPPMPDWSSYATESVPNFLTDTVRPPTISPSLSGMRKSVPAIRKPEKSRAKLAAWLVIAALCVALVVLLFVGRTQIVLMWPSAEPIYAAFGLRTPVAGSGLELVGVKSELQQIDGKPTLIVTGRVTNITGMPQKVSALTITLRDKLNMPIKSWSITPSQSSLLPSEGMAFQASLVTPPANAASASVAFSDLPVK